MKNTIFYIVIGCLIGYILFFKIGLTEVKQPVIVKSDTVTLIDTIKIPVNEKWEKPKPIAIIGAGEDEIKLYSRKLVNDSIGSLILTDSVKNNELLGYSLAGKINTFIEIQKVTTYIESPKRNKVLIGLNLAYTPAFVSVYPTATLITKKGYGFSVGYDAINKIYYGGISKTISFK